MFCYCQADTHYQNALHQANYRITKSNRQLPYLQTSSTALDHMITAEFCEVPALPAAQCFVVSHVKDADARILPFIQTPGKATIVIAW